jgi:hypothetical protein
MRWTDFYGWFWPAFRKQYSDLPTGRGYKRGPDDNRNYVGMRSTKYRGVYAHVGFTTDGGNPRAAYVEFYSGNRESKGWAQFTAALADTSLAAGTEFRPVDAGKAARARHVIRDKVSATDDTLQDAELRKSMADLYGWAVSLL